MIKFASFNPVVLSEELPLNPANSTSQTSNPPRLGYESAVDEAEKRLLAVVKPSNPDCNRLRNTPREKSKFIQQNGKNVLLLEPQQDRQRSVGNLRDINAMSVASIYDQELDEIMDADK